MSRLLLYSDSNLLHYNLTSHLQKTGFSTHFGYLPRDKMLAITAAFDEKWGLLTNKSMNSQPPWLSVSPHPLPNSPRLSSGSASPVKFI